MSMLNKSTKLLVIIILLLNIVILLSCQDAIEEPIVKITYGTDELRVIYHGNLYNSKQNDIEKRIKSFMINKRFTYFPIIHFGDEIQIEALNFKTNKLEVYSYIVDESGNIISDYNIKPITLTLTEGGSANFIFEKRQDLEKYIDFEPHQKVIYCLLIKSKVNNSSFAFSTLLLEDDK